MCPESVGVMIWDRVQTSEWRGRHQRTVWGIHVGAWALARPLHPHPSPEMSNISGRREWGGRGWNTREHVMLLLEFLQYPVNTGTYNFNPSGILQPCPHKAVPYPIAHLFLGHMLSAPGVVIHETIGQSGEVTDHYISSQEQCRITSQHHKEKVKNMCI